mmetsp:Transcript_14923/g.20226  ORF Transcript_14923/g.20226 Transcript_14923/m.20226 type:complete len:95 (+) Transcript_14923:979-1263(+)
MDGVPDPSASDPAPVDQAPKPDLDVKDVVNTDFMKGLVDELGLDLNQDGLGDLIGQQPAAATEENKQEEEKKDDGANKDNNAGGDAASKDGQDK